MPLLPVVRRAAATALGAGVAAGTALAAYGAWEARQYTLREVTVPLLPAGHRPLRVLHLSDIHMAPDQRAKQEWLRGLADLEPDLVVDTGDNLAHRRSVPVVLDSLGAAPGPAGHLGVRLQRLLLAGVAQPRALPAARHRPAQHPHPPAALARPAAAASSTPAGCTCATSAASLKVGDTTFALAGVDDPHLQLRRPRRGRRTRRPHRRRARSAITHAPYLRVLDRFAADGYDAVLAGHTHGGQVCLPGYGALTTNCDLEPARAKGLHRHPADSRPGDPGSSWLHVSAGLGHQPLRPVPGRVPPRGDPADPRPAPEPACVRHPTPAVSPISEASERSGMLAVLRRRSSAAERIGLWRSLVARLVRDEEAAGSNPVSPTM